MEDTRRDHNKALNPVPNVILFENEDNFGAIAKGILHFSLLGSPADLLKLLDGLVPLLFVAICVENRTVIWVAFSKSSAHICFLGRVSHPDLLNVKNPYTKRGLKMA
jgi:hypothetical protein